MTSKSVVVVGGGLAGLSSAVALAEAGFRVRLFERRPHLGGRATSYLLPTGEYVDNCQHVTLGCCTNLSDFYRRVGAAGKIRFYDRLFFLDRRGRRGVIEASPLAAPFHLAPSFLLFPSLGWAAKRAVAQAMLVIARAAGRPADAPGATMQDWLLRHAQPAEAIERFWRVVLVSALDETLERIEARYAVEVFWKAFLANPHGFEVGIPSVPLAELYAGCREAIEGQGGEVRTRSAIRELRLADASLIAARLEDASEIHGDFFVIAVPHDVLLELLPEGIAAGEPVFANLRNLRVSPITGVHFWYDRPVMAEPFLSLLDRTVQWIFNKTRLTFPREAGDLWMDNRRDRAKQPRERVNGEGQYLELVISASYDLVARSRQEIIDLCRQELSEALPATREARLLKATVIKEVAATFSPQPGSDRWRPSQQSPIKNLFLAGDWTNTGWPATMEGAVRSGYLAAEAILALAGQSRKLVQPDLPAEGLAARWAAEGDRSPH